MRNLPDRKKKQTLPKKKETRARVPQHQTRSSKSPGWDAAYDLVEWLWVTLKERDISDQRLAEQTGISFNTIRSWKKTRRIPSLAFMAACARCLGFRLIPARDTAGAGHTIISPVREFRRELLESSLRIKARKAKKTYEQYVKDQSNEEARHAYLEQQRLFREAQGEEAQDDIVEAAKMDPSVRGRLRWNG